MGVNRLGISLHFGSQTMMPLPRIRGLLLVMSVVALPSTALAELPSIEALQERCKDKTDVYSAVGGKLVQLGERIDQYCVGFLEGILATLENEKRACPEWKNNRIDTDYLVSVVNHYVEDQMPGDLNASIVVTEAFERAFPCDDE